MASRSLRYRRYLQLGRGGGGMFWRLLGAFAMCAVLVGSVACSGDDDTGSSGGDTPLACSFFSKSDAERVLSGAVGEPEGGDIFAPQRAHSSSCTYRLRERDDQGRDTLRVTVQASTQTQAVDSGDNGAGFTAFLSGDGLGVSVDAKNAKKAPLKSDVEKLATSIHAKAKKSCIVNSRCKPKPTPTP